MVLRGQNCQNKKIWLEQVGQQLKDTGDTETDTRTDKRKEF